VRGLVVTKLAAVVVVVLFVTCWRGGEKALPVSKTSTVTEATNVLAVQ
jgi:hypothetical protein